MGLIGCVDNITIHKITSNIFLIPRLEDMQDKLNGLCSLSWISNLVIIILELELGMNERKHSRLIRDCMSDLSCLFHFATLLAHVWFAECKSNRDGYGY